MLKASWSKSETLPEQAKLWDHVRATKVVKDEVTSNVGNTAEAMGKESVKTVGFLRLCDPYARLDGAVLRDRRFKDGMLTSWSALEATHDLRNSSR